MSINIYDAPGGPSGYMLKSYPISKLAFTAGTPEKASGNWELVTGLLTGEIGDEPDAEEEGTFVAQAGGRIGTPEADEAASSASA
jgi:hypothetical protein